MLNFDLYAISTTKDECHSSIDEFFSSFEEAMAHRMEYADWWAPTDWWAPKGTVTIEKYPAGSKSFYPSEEWDIRADGSIKEHRIYNRR